MTRHSGIRRSGWCLVALLVASDGGGCARYNFDAPRCESGPCLAADSTPRDGARDQRLDPDAGPLDGDTAHDSGQPDGPAGQPDMPALVADLPAAADLVPTADLAPTADLPAVADLPAAADLPTPVADLPAAADLVPWSPDSAIALPDASAADAAGGGVYPGWSEQATLAFTAPPGQGVAVRVEVNTASRIADGTMRADCGDIRFAATSIAVSAKLAYWLQSGCDTSQTVLWVRLPQLSSAAKLVLYHGNPAASSESNGSATFDLFDDFLGTVLDGALWSDWNPDKYGSLTLSNSVLRIDVPGHAAKALRARGVVSQAPFAFEDHVVELRCRWTFADMSTTGENVQREVQLSTVASPAAAEAGDQYEWDFQWYRGLFGVHTGTYRFVVLQGGSYSEPDKHVAQTPSPTQFQIEQYNWRPAGESGLFSTDGGSSFQPLWSADDTMWALPAQRYVGLSLENLSTMAHSFEIDWVRVRRWTSLPTLVFP